MSQLQADIIAEIEEAQDGLAAERSTAFLALVRRIVGGEAMEPKAVAAELDRVGKSIAEFKAACATQKQRVELRERFDKGNELRPQQSILAEEERKARAEYAKAATAFEQRMQSIDERRREVDNAVFRGDTAREKLRETCLDTALLTREAKLHERRLVVLKEIDAAQRRVKYQSGQVDEIDESFSKAKEDFDQRWKLQQHNRGIVGNVPTFKHPAMESNLLQQREALEQCESELAALQEQLAAIDAELADILEAKIAV